MSLSHDFARDEQLVRYLLGQLPEEDSERLDALCLADDEIAGRLQAVENDLVDRYANGTLAGPTLSQFQRIYLTSPRRLQKVRFAESLLQLTQRPSVSAEAAPKPAEAPGAQASSGQERPRTRGGRWFEQLAWPVNVGWGLAAATVLLVALGVLQYRTTRLRAELQIVQIEREALHHQARELAQQLGDQRVASAEAARELEQVQARLAEAMRASAESSSSASGPPQVLAAMLLQPLMRSSGPVPTLVVPARARTAAFDLQLEPADFRHYQVTLRDPATNAIAWRSARLAPARSGPTRTISLAVPVRVLKAQHYSFELSGLRDSGDGEPLAGYAFRIVLR
jgi:hypothetical protein